jgi:hypothetical protein
MLVVAGGVVKSGSTALYQYIRELVWVYTNGFAPQMPEGSEDEYFDSHLRDWVESNQWHVVKLHAWRDSLEPYRDNTNMRVVMTYRDLRDTCLSVRDFRNDTFEGVIASKILQRIRDAELNWNKKMNGLRLMPFSYKFMRTHPAQAIYQIGIFMNMNISLDQAQGIAEKWSIHANRARAARNYHYTEPDFMSPRHISSGNVERWKTELTKEQCRIVQDHVGVDWFYERGYEVV